MRILIDSHIWLWMLGEPEKLSKEVTELVIDPKNQIYVSIASYWELQIKATLGRLTLPPKMISASSGEGISVIDITTEHIERLQELPLIHRDPIDRILLATALQEQMCFLTVDTEVLAYQNIEGLAFISV